MANEQEDPSVIINEVINNIKSSGTFDKLRRECMEKMGDTEAYSQMERRMSNHVTSFLSKQRWDSKTSKNALRDGLRKHINESEVLQNGVHTLIEQVLLQYRPIIGKHIGDEVDKYFHSNERTSESIKDIISDTPVAEDGPSTSTCINNHIKPDCLAQNKEETSSSINQNGKIETTTSKVNLVESDPSQLESAKPTTDNVTSQSETLNTSDIINTEIKVEVPPLTELKSEPEAEVNEITDSEVDASSNEVNDKNTLVKTSSSDLIECSMVSHVTELLKESIEKNDSPKHDVLPVELNVSFDEDSKVEQTQAEEPTGSTASVDGDQPMHNYESDRNLSTCEVAHSPEEKIPDIKNEVEHEKEIDVSESDAIKQKTEVTHVDCSEEKPTEESNMEDIAVNSGTEESGSIDNVIHTTVEADESVYDIKGCAIEETIEDDVKDKIDTNIGTNEKEVEPNCTGSEKDLNSKEEDNKRKIEETKAEEDSTDETIKEKCVVTRGKRKSSTAKSQIEEQESIPKIEQNISKSKRRKTVPIKSIIRETPSSSVRSKRKASEIAVDGSLSSTNRSGKARKQSVVEKPEQNVNKETAVKRPRRNIKPKQCYSP